MYYYLLAFIAGMALTTQIGVNGRLMAYLGTPLLTSFMSFFVGTLGLGAVYIANLFIGAQSLPEIGSVGQSSLWMWGGGLIGGFYVLVSIFCAPKIGFANMFSLVVAGQIILAVAFDHFGILSTNMHELNIFRVIGVLLLIIGVYIIQTH